MVGAWYHLENPKFSQAFPMFMELVFFITSYNIFLMEKSKQGK